MSILERKKTTSSYLVRLASNPKGTAANAKTTINNFMKFTEETLSSTPEQISEELTLIKKNKGDEKYEDSLYAMLQDFNRQGKRGRN